MSPHEKGLVNVIIALTAVVIFTWVIRPAASAAGDDYIMPQIPTEAEKVEALKRAYRLNGDSMVGFNRMIDLTDPAMWKADRIITTVPVRPEAPPPPPKTEKKKEVQVADTCTRHGLRKVITGSSWRCRK